MAIKSRRVRWSGRVAHKEEMRKYNVLFGKSDGRKPLERPRSRREIVDWIHVTSLGDSSGLF
jgi:hypothetical protein